MLKHSFSYDDCLTNSIRAAWKEDEVFAGKDFDFSKRFLPDRLSGVDGIACLNEDEKRKLNQITGNAYCHIFAFVEEFIIAQTMEAAQREPYGNEVRLRALLRFAEEELKHQELFRRSMALFEKGFGTDCALIPGREDVAKVVLSKSRLCSLLLTSLIEWFTQLHYLEHVKDNTDLDQLFRELLKRHWVEEAQHAKLDSLLIDETAETLSPEQREKAIDELLELGMAVDALLSQQIDLNIKSLEKATGRSFTDKERDEIRENQQRAYRWTFLVSGLRHPNFVKIVRELTKQGAGKVEAAAASLAA